MTVPAGTRFGHYEIHGPLGAGGMGEVYRGRDTRLNRPVAIKVLTALADSDRDQRQRFEREARVIASLSHPNICVLYDVGEQDSAPFIVMEYLEGETLAGRLARSPLSIDSALTIATEMLDALEHAHRRGVVHRDLKPSNVMLTAASAKLLDFGLAKIADIAGAEEKPGPTSAQDASSITRTVPVTMEGTILGSLNYMAPEQLHGHDVDARTDLFAFGVVLYEMVTGRRAFTGPSNASVIAAILERQPERVATLAPHAPSLLDHIVTKCLAKNPDERWQSATDLKQALAWARAGVGAPAARRGVERSLLRKIVPVALLTGVAFVAGSAATLRFVPPPPPDIASHGYRPLATEEDYQGSAAFSPDGKSIVYVAEKNGIVQVLTRALDHPTPVVITDRPFNCRSPFWNENGTKIYFISAAGEGEGLFVVGAAGGEPDSVLPQDVSVAAAALSPDGQMLAYLREEGLAGANAKTLWIQSPLSAEPKREPRFANVMFGDGELAFSPDSQTLGIWGSINEGLLDGARTFWVLPVRGGEPRKAINDLPAGSPSFSWLRDSRHILGTISQPPDTHLWVFDTVSGHGWPVTSGMSRNSHPTVSRTGQVAMNSEHADVDLLELFLDKSPPAPLLATARQEFDPAWAGSDRYAFVSDRMGRQQIWMRSRRDPQGAMVDRKLVDERDFPGLTLTLAEPAFSPNGQRFAFSRYEKMSTLYVSTVDSRPVPLLPTPAVSFAPTWSPDNLWVAFTGPGATTTWELRKMLVGGNDGPVVISADIAPHTRPQWSPDPRWIAAETSGGLALISADKRADPVILSEQYWFAYAWLDARHLVGIRQSPNRRLMLSTIDVATKEERVVLADFGPVPLVNRPIQGMTRTSTGSFVIGLTRAGSSIVLLDGLRTPGFWDRWRVGPRAPWQTPQP